METVTIPDVELLSIGTHFAATGPTTISEDDITSMLAAAADAEVDHAGIRIGHFDPRFDGEPALGWLANLRRVGNKLVGDLTQVPAKLAETMKSAYRRRSVEIDWNVKTPSGKTYKAVISGLALLGVQKPAVKGLADVVSQYSTGASVAESTSSLLVFDGVDVGAVFAAADGTRRADPENRPDTGNRDTTGGDAMTDAQIRELLGLAADAPITDKMRAIAATQQALAADPVLGELAKLSDDERAKVTEYATAVKAAEDAAAKEAADAKAKADADAAAAAAAAGGEGPKMVSIDAEALAVLQAQGAAGAGAMKILDEQTRDGELAAALSAGKIAPASVPQWKALWDTDRDKTRALLAASPQVFSTVTTEVGSSSSLSGGTAAGAAEDAAWDKFEAEIFGIQPEKGA